MAKAVKPIVLSFDLDHPTKGAFQFKEPPQSGRPVCGSLYLTKEGVEKAGWGETSKIKVTIERVG